MPARSSPLSPRRAAVPGLCAAVLTRECSPWPPCLGAPEALTSPHGKKNETGLCAQGRGWRPAQWRVGAVAAVGDEGLLPPLPVNPRAALELLDVCVVPGCRCIPSVSGGACLPPLSVRLFGVF